MNEAIQILVDSLRRGQYEDPTEKISLLAAALREHDADVPLLLSLLRAPQIPLRLAALAACRENNELALTAELIKFVNDPEERVRCKAAETLGSIFGKETTEALRQLIQDADEDVRMAALKGGAIRPDLLELQEKRLSDDSSWRVRSAAASALGEQKHPRIAGPVFKALANDADGDVRKQSAEVLEKRFVANAAAVQKHLPVDIALLTKAERQLKELGGQRFPQLLAWISSHTTGSVDPEELAKFGTDLTALAESGTLPRAYCFTEHCATLLKLLGRQPARSVALIGAAGTGKSALVNELVYELIKPENGGWRVLRISPSDFMAGTKYLGEWETKVRELVAAVKRPRRVIVYVPNLSQLSTAGTWDKSESNVATALAPYLEEGSVLLLGESGPDEFERGLGRVPSLQRLFDRVLLDEAGLETTRNILVAVRDEQKLAIDDGVLGQLLELSGQFLSHISRPGGPITLLRTVEEATRNSGRPITFREILDALSKSTGIPSDILDDSVPLNTATVKAFFEKRIIGQPEAVDVVLDLVTLIKAGLTDPQKPFGVFLFVGPTGVGKTELARTLAEYIFGDASRLKRFDMSEFASVDGFVKLIGSASENGLLTDAVRQHPFSVILLDEIEKSHLNVFDLCLQIFDAGRLTDGRGRTVDFRRTIVILTSNIGASIPTAQLGFRSNPGAPDDADKDRTFRELSRFFRPEFLNRIDRIVQFRALSLEVAEQIARREVDLVLQRSGIRRRALTVDVSPSIVALLVREGYSPHFGARPLKRTVERLLLLPLARAIASGNIREQTILHLNQRDGRIEITTTRAKPTERAVEQKEEKTVLSLEKAIAELCERFDATDAQVRPLAERKSELLSKTQQSGFYDDAVSRSATFDEIHKLDEFLVSWNGLEKALSGLQRRLQERRPTKAEEGSLRERIEQLSVELEQLCFVAVSKNARDLGDALICVSIVERVGESQDGVEKLVGMYQALAKRRRMTTEVLGEYFEGKQDCAYLQVSGLGCYSLLKNESGLHQLDRKFKLKVPRTGREVIKEDREVLRVEVLPLAGEPDKRFRDTVKSKLASLKPARERIVKSDTAVSLFHEASLRSIALWTEGPRNTALEKAFIILYGQVSTGATQGEGEKHGIIRQYELGLSPRIKDARTGRFTTNVDRVLKGHLDALLLAQ